MLEEIMDIMLGGGGGGGGAVPVLTLLPSRAVFIGLPVKRAGVLEPKSREVSGSKFKKGKGKIMCRIISRTFQDSGTTVIQTHCFDIRTVLYT